MGPDPGQDKVGGPFALFDSGRDVLGGDDGRRRSGNRGPGQRNRILVVAVVVVAVAAAGGALAVLQNQGHARAAAQPTHRASTTAAQSASPAQGTPAASGSAVVPLSSGPASSPPVSPTAGGGSTGVAVAPSAASNPAAPRVVAFLNRYFTAINQHDYAAFAHLLDQQVLRQMPAAAFDSGYATTTDSGESLTGISDAGSGGVAAMVTFTSHQQPAESIDDSACTSWAITLYLVPNGTGYLIGEPPPGYHASYQAC